MATTDAYGQNISIAALTDTPSAFALAFAIVDSLTPRSVMRFASATARSATITSPVEGMVTWLQDVNRLEVYNGSTWGTPPYLLTTTTSGATAPSGFSLISFSAYRASGVITANFCSTRIGSTIGADAAGNIADTLIGTLPSGWRPPETIFASVGDGFGCGECSIGSDGAIALRAWSGSGAIVAGRNLRVTCTFVAGN